MVNLGSQNPMTELSSHCSLKDQSGSGVWECGKVLFPGEQFSQIEYYLKKQSKIGCYNQCFLVYWFSVWETFSMSSSLATGCYF